MTTSSHLEMSNFSLYQRWSIKHLGRLVHFCQRDALTVLEAAFYFNKEFSSVIPGRTLDSRIICTLCAALRSLVARDMRLFVKWAAHNVGTML